MEKSVSYICGKIVIFLIFNLFSEIIVLKAGLSIYIQKTKVMTSGPITSWQIDRETVETVIDIILFLTPKSVQMMMAAMKLKEAYSLE